MKVFYDKDADLSIIKAKKVAIIGYGSQGHVFLWLSGDFNQQLYSAAVYGAGVGVCSADHGLGTRTQFVVWASGPVDPFSFNDALADAQALSTRESAQSVLFWLADQPV